jgi:glutathione S-transferase
MLLDLLGLKYAIIDVPFGNRTELARLTNGYIQVPVLVDAQGQVTIDSRNICKKLLDSKEGKFLLPAAIQNEIWSYADWCDGTLEDVLFRIATPGISRKFNDAWEKALYIFIKERKFGTGCVLKWENQSRELMQEAQGLLKPTLEKLSETPFIFGERPTLADAALYGQFVMLKVAAPHLPSSIAPGIENWMKRLEAATLN